MLPSVQTMFAPEGGHSAARVSIRRARRIAVTIFDNVGNYVVIAVRFAEPGYVIAVGVDEHGALAIYDAAYFGNGFNDACQAVVADAVHQVNAAIIINI